MRLYVGPLTVGNIEFNVTLDTGSSDLWIFGSGGSCDIPCGPPGCQADPENPVCCMPLNFPEYRTVKGSSFHIQYGKGWVDGYTGFDTVGLAGYEATAKIGVATSWDPSIIDCEETMNGILGLGYKQKSEEKADSLITVLKNNGQIEKKMFSFYLSETENLFMLGEPNPDYYDHIVWSDVYKPERYGMWWIRMHGMGIKYTNKNETILRSGYTEALIDSGTSYLLMPIKEFNNFRAYIDEARSDCIVPDEISDNGIVCKNYENIEGMPDMWFNIAGRKLVLNPQDYLIRECIERLPLEVCEAYQSYAT
eukprot:UN25509